MIPIRALVEERFERLRRLYETGQEITGMPSGLHALDRLTGGFQAGELILAAAAPSIGKTALVLSIAASAAIRDRVATVVVTAAASHAELADRLIASEAQLDSAKLRTARLHAEDWEQLCKACERLSEAPLVLDDSALTVDDVSASSLPDRVGLLLVDQVNALVPAEPARETLASSCQGLRRLAQLLRMPVLAALSSPSVPQTRADQRPRLADLQASGVIPTADTILLLHRPQAYEPCPDQQELVELIIVKHRSGPLDTVKVGFQRRCGRFSNLA